LITTSWLTAYSRLGRLREIVQVLFRYGFGYFIDQLDLRQLLSPFEKPIAHPEPTSSLGVRLRRALEDLGPTFIKLGQLLSTRSDLLPPDVIVELAKLQDQVPPVPFELIRQVIETELGQPLEKIFSSFEQTPLGSASLGQVHLATLPDHRQVVVKVQRPGVAKIIDTDLLVLADLARLAEHRTPWGRIYSFSEMVEEFSRSLREELDYTVESRHAERIAAGFNGDPTVRIPAVLWELTTTKISTQEYFAGISLEDHNALVAAGYSLSSIAQRLTQAMIKQVLEIGYFHADPHPGNILVLPGEIIGFLDFGLVGYLSAPQKEIFIRMIMAGYRRQTDTLIQCLKELGTTTVPIKEEELHHDIDLLLDKYFDLPLSRIKLGQAIKEIMDIAFRHQLRLPSDFTLLAKTIITLEGVVTELDPGISIIEIIQPVATRFIRQRYSLPHLLRTAQDKLSAYRDLAEDIPRLLRTFLRQAVDGQLKINWTIAELQTMLRHLDRISNRLSFSMVLLAFSIIMASLILGSALARPYDPNRILLWRLPYLEIGFLTAGIMVGWLLWAIFRSGRL
jgi:ubiquinone biosynthesis protein